MTAALLALSVVLLLANAFFVAVEFALVASRRSALEPMAEAGDRRARRSLAAVEDLNVQLAGSQLGITMASLGLGAVAEPALAHVIESVVERFGEVPEGVLHGVGFVVAERAVLRDEVRDLGPRVHDAVRPRRALDGPRDELAHTNGVDRVLEDHVLRVREVIEIRERAHGGQRHAHPRGSEQRVLRGRVRREPLGDAALRQLPTRRRQVLRWSAAARGEAACDEGRRREERSGCEPTESPRGRHSE